MYAGHQDLGEGDTGEGEEGEEEVFYMLNDERVRMIQIEGENDNYYMNDRGNIFTLEGVEIGTANLDSLEGF